MDVEYAEAEAAETINFGIKMGIDTAANCWIKLKDCCQLGERFRKKYERNIIINCRDLRLYGCERSLQNQSCIEK